MPEIILYTACSLDGFIAPEDGTLDWLERPEFRLESEDFGYASLLNGTEVLVMGRTTYDQVAAFGQWPYPEKRVVVFSHREIAHVPEGVSTTSQAPEEWLKNVQAGLSGNIWLVGGGLLNRGFWEADLVDRLIVTFLPVVLGAGRPLFSGARTSRPLQLIRQQAWPNGMVQLEYTLNRAV